LSLHVNSKHSCSVYFGHLITHHQLILQTGVPYQIVFNGQEQFLLITFRSQFETRHFTEKHCLRETYYSPCSGDVYGE